MGQYSNCGRDLQNDVLEFHVPFMGHPAKTVSNLRKAQFHQAGCSGPPGLISIHPRILARGSAFSHQLALIGGGLAQEFLQVLYVSSLFGAPGGSRRGRRAFGYKPQIERAQKWAGVSFDPTTPHLDDNDVDRVVLYDVPRKQAVRSPLPSKGDVMCLDWPSLIEEDDADIGAALKLETLTGKPRAYVQAAADFFAARKARRRNGVA